MNFSISFIRTFFILLSIFFFTAYSISYNQSSFSLMTVSLGVLGGVAFAVFLLGMEQIFKSFNLRAFNLAALGLFFGYLMSQALLFTYDLAIESNVLAISPAISGLLKVTILLFSAYFGMILTVRAADELSVSVPFVKFKPTQQKKKDILLDTSILSDPRLIDLANSGLLDQQLILPRVSVKDLHQQAELGDDTQKTKVRKCLEIVKKLETLPGLGLRYVDNDFPDVKDHHAKLMKLARHIDANILTADINKIQQSEMEGLKVININFLSQALKPITSAGEHIQIKIQRYGKEPRQGVGYLDDGTMVVVNGGAEFIGENIKALVLSVKHTSSGRMIFCNALDESLTGQEQELEPAIPLDLENGPRNYFTL